MYLFVQNCRRTDLLYDILIRYYVFIYFDKLRFNLNCLRITNNLYFIIFMMMYLKVMYFGLCVVVVIVIDDVFTSVLYRCTSSWTPVEVFCAHYWQITTSHRMINYFRIGNEWCLCVCERARPTILFISDCPSVMTVP